MKAILLFSTPYFAVVGESNCVVIRKHLSHNMYVLAHLLGEGRFHSNIATRI